MLSIRWMMKMRSESVTLVLVNLANIMENADLHLLPGVYKELGAALHAGPTALGSLTSCRLLVQSLCYPIAAYLTTRNNRAHVIALGVFLWAAATFLVAISTTFLQVLTSPSSVAFICLWSISLVIYIVQNGHQIQSGLLTDMFLCLWSQIN